MGSTHDNAPAHTDTPPPYGTVVFDCDSTLSAIEGIEELAGPRHAEEIERLTTAAMAGEVPLEEVFGRRLELVAPSASDLARVGERYVEEVLLHVNEVVAALHALDKRVVVVSGGLLPAVRVLGHHLGVDEVHAVDVRFASDGAYAGFDETSPLARAGGKIDVVRGVAARDGAGRVALVGDGATDLEAAGVVARFVAFGGVVRRANVFAAAHVATDSADFKDLLPLLLSTAELETLRTTPAFVGLV